MARITSKGKIATLTQEGNDLPRLAQPTQRALAAAGVKTLEQISRFSEAEVKEWHGIGPNALTVLRRALKERGLSFAADEKKEK